VNCDGARGSRLQARALREEPTVRITTLVDNRPSPRDLQLTAEWGLSLCVELNGRHLLIDMGASDAFARNAERLSIDVAAIDVAIVSHPHYDHGGGRRRFLELNDHAPIYLGGAPDGDPTVKLLGLVRKYVGLDQALLARVWPRPQNQKHSSSPDGWIGLISRNALLRTPARLGPVELLPVPALATLGGSTVHSAGSTIGPAHPAAQAHQPARRCAGVRRCRLTHSHPCSLPIGSH
jgi:hypothetical protein